MPLRELLAQERETLSAMIIRVRKRAGYTQAEIAKELGVSPTSWNAYEKGRTDISAGLLLQFARLVEATGVDFGLERDPDPGQDPWSGDWTVEQLHKQGRPLYWSRSWLISEVERLGNVKLVAEEHGLNASTLHRWYVKYRGGTRRDLRPPEDVDRNLALRLKREERAKIRQAQLEALKTQEARFRRPVGRPKKT